MIFSVPGPGSAGEKQLCVARAKRILLGWDHSQNPGESAGERRRRMKIFRTSEYVRMKNPTPGQRHRSEILTGEHEAKDLGGILGILAPGTSPPYHYHKKRESIIIAISGEAVEILEGKEIPIQAGDVIFIPPGEKHTTVNRSSQEFRYLEFFTCPPVGKDFVEVK
jgi:quercetin dioxygenase-like cupin family protein